MNDETSFSFIVSRNKPRENHDPKSYPLAQDIIDAILDGRMRIKDVDPYHPRLFHIQDSIATAGQGRIHDDRENEQLGRSDIAVIKLRQIYEREVSAIRDGKAIKQWKRPKEMMIVGFFPKAAE
jgi:5,5'-dehydrodivanillate O-demethylase oxygenase subunit